MHLNPTEGNFIVYASLRGQSVALVRGKDRVTPDEFRVMRQIAFDSLPSRRAKTLTALRKKRKTPQSIDQLQTVLDGSQSTIRRTMDDFADLRPVRVTEKTKQRGKPKTKLYQLSDHLTEKLTSIHAD